MADRSAKHRVPRHDGEHNPNAKLAQADVETIRHRLAIDKANQHELAAEYGVTKTTIWEIMTNRTWKC
jgi:predicted DNA-binding protein (UPF0251 family)